MSCVKCFAIEKVKCSSSMFCAYIYFRSETSKNKRPQNQFAFGKNVQNGDVSRLLNVITANHDPVVNLPSAN